MSNEKAVEVVRLALSGCATRRGYRLRDEREPLARAAVEALESAGMLRSQPDPLRELAEWLVSLRPVAGVRSSVVGLPDVRLEQAIERAREALGKED